MVRYINVLVVLVFIFGCGYDKRSKKYHIRTTSFCDGKVYVEDYNVFSAGGAVGGNITSSYLADSTNFRMYVGSYDEVDGGYSYKCQGDSVIIYEIIGQSINKNKIVSTRSYSLSALKTNKKFE